MGYVVLRLRYWNGVENGTKITMGGLKILVVIRMIQYNMTRRG